MVGYPNLVSFFDEITHEISDGVYDHIRSMYEAHYGALRQQQGESSCRSNEANDREENECTSTAEAQRHMDRFLRALRAPPGTTYVRVNFFDTTTSSQDGAESPPPFSSDDECARRRVDAVVQHLTKTVEDWVRREQQEPQQQRNLGSSDEGGASDEDPDDIRVLVNRHGVLPDVVVVRIERHRTRESILTSVNKPGPTEQCGCEPGDDSPHPRIGRKRVICDRLCGEAIMRGSNAFVRGILCADPGILPGEGVDVYANVPTTLRSGAGATAAPIQTRGLHVDKFTGRAVFLGRGVAACSRPDFFRLESGVAIRMSLRGRVGPILPPLPVIPGGMLQNLPSIVVGHVLQPQQNQNILDMCAAPGGKTLHVASLVRNQATIVACDRSRSKMVAARAMFQEHGATCIVPLAVDSTRLLENPNSNETPKSVNQILSEAQVGKCGLLDVRQFPPESFDRIVLDPPCSALGLRPKLMVDLSYNSLQSFASYQRKMVEVAIQLLKPGGILTYSTCTINHEENEQLIRYVLDSYGHAVQLEPVDFPLGGPGLAGVGLTETERRSVRRFDPADDPTDSIGFFLAKFRKRGT